MTNSSVRNILCVGDVVGPAAVEHLRQQLWRFRREHEVDFTVVNGENACPGNGLDTASAKALLDAGADVLTSGNHIWHRRDIYAMLDADDRLLRPANYPPADPGTGYTIQRADGFSYLVINVLGTIFMDALENPFFCIERILEREQGRYDIAICDIHAEATSEKAALARYFDGRIHIVFGTHTHVPTADVRVLPQGTGFVTDLGMTGPVESVLGVKPSCIISRLTTSMPCRFELADGPVEAQCVLFTVDTVTGQVTKAARFSF